MPMCWQDVRPGDNAMRSLAEIDAHGKAADWIAGRSNGVEIRFDYVASGIVSTRRITANSPSFSARP
jgi:hypothetical protein